MAPIRYAAAGPATVLLRTPLVLALLAATAGVGRADRITLRGGGQVRGKVIVDPQHADRVTILTETGKTPLSFQKAQILQVQAEPGPLDEYVDRREQVAATAQGQYELGLWCEEHALKDLATVHYEASLKQDKTFAPAHRKLGHVLIGDRWVWGDELRETQGLVRYKGRWITLEEKERRDAEDAAGAEQASWLRRLKLLRQSLLNGPDDRSRDAEDQLFAIRDPMAVTPLIQVFGGEADTFRKMLDRVLERIPGPEAAAGLVRHVLAESDVDVRHVTIDALGKRKEPNVVPGLVKALGSDDPAIVNRAAWSLGELKAVTTVPKLIPALITTQKQIIMPPIDAASPSGGNFSASFGSVSPTPSLGSSYFGTGATYGVLTPPVVGPGVVAFGATGVPFPYLPNASFSTGGGYSGPRNQIPRIVTISIQNVEVLATLTKLTGQDFGFDIPAWQHWVSSSFRPDPAPVRRVPQP